MRRRSRQRARQPPIQNLPTPSLGATSLLRRTLTGRSASSSPSPPRSSSRGSHSSAGSGSSGPSRRRTTTRPLTPRRPTASPNARFRTSNPGGGANTAARALARSQATTNSGGPATLNRNTRSGSRRAQSSRRPATHNLSNQSIGSAGTRPGTRSRRRTTTAAPPIPSSPSKNSILVLNNGTRVKTPKKKPRSKSHVSFVLPDSSAKIVMTSDKYLAKILSYLNWNELNSARAVSKQWLNLVASDPNLQSSSGVITITKNVNDVFKVFNASLSVWTQFRLNSNTVFDLTQPIQSEFWWKHGATMQYLEIRNNSLTLSSLVEILSRTTNLIHLLVTWTAEMYSFNSELIRKYYGIHFRNGTFSKLQSLTIERTSFLTDNALWSILKWCGSALNSLTLSCGHDEQDDNLSRLKPRWTLEPVENFANRFGYSGNFKFLDFTGSNLLPVDLVRMAEMEKLTHLLGLRLSHCKINDESLITFLVKKGAKLEELYLDYTPVSDSAFNFKEHKDIKLGRLRVLSISGTTHFRNFGFISELVSLEAFYCSDTPWLTTNMITKPLEQHHMTAVRSLKKLDLSSNEKLSNKSVDLNLCHIWFIHFTTVVGKLSELDLSQWTQFGNDTNFKAICNNMPQLRKLRLRSWKDLTDEGVTGVTYQELAEFEEIRKDIWRTIESHTKSRPLIGKLKHLELLDLARCGLLSDMSIQFGILFLPNLRALNLSGSQVSDAGIHVLIAKSKTLDKLSLMGCERITPKGRRVHRLDGRAVFFGVV